MPTPLPEKWDYCHLSGTLFISNGSFNEEVAKSDWCKTELKFKLALPEDVKKIITEKMLNYFTELAQEKEQEREQQIQNLIKYVCNPNDTL